MHTLTVQTAEAGEVTINHNSDWSGMAIVTWQDEDNGPHREVRVPAEALAACGRKRVLRDAVIALENLEAAAHD